jgi:hypothetical protein
MITVKNVATGEQYEINYVRVRDGKIVTDSKTVSTRFTNKYGQYVTIIGRTDEGRAVLAVNDGWELVKNAKKQKPTTDAAPAPQAPVEQPADVHEDEQPEAVADFIEEQAVEANCDAEQASSIEQPQPQPAGVPNTDALTSAFTALTPLFAGVQKNVTDAVMMTLQPIIEQLKKQAATQIQHIQITNSAGETHQIDEVVCSDFEEMLTYLSEGVPVYMWGAAGCGKSHTARQLADALGLPFYESMQVMFAHDVKGYGDAGGNYQATPFFKAFTEGGVFFLDEVDASAPEALVVLNTAIANRRFDFPIVGNVTAHPNFRVIAAGNTAMTGADLEYVARSVQDAATENRFSFFEMKYDRRVELPVCAQGDEVLMNFITDLRQAIRAANIIKCVSYRQTTLLANQALLKFGRVNALRRNVFKGMEADEIKIIYGYLTDTRNIWAQAMSQLFDNI